MADSMHSVAQLEKVDATTLNQGKHCKVHEEQVLRFFCQTCEELICQNCTVGNHPVESHTVVNLQNASSEQKTDINRLARSCEDVKKKLEDAMKGVESVSEQLEKNATTAEEELDEAFNRAVRLLEDNRNRLKGEVKTVVSENKKQINEEKDALEVQQTRLVTTLQMATEVVQTVSVYDLAPVYSSFETNLTILRDMKSAGTTANLGDVSFEPAQDIHQAIQNLGSISSCCRGDEEEVSTCIEDKE